MAIPTFWLSMHVPYACRHAGACCESGWDIPLERSRVDAIRLIRSDTAWLTPPPAHAPADVAGILARTESGRCVFRGVGCAIHGALGHQALPTACQHFPREVLIDPRGVFVTLSHYCPTAADLLFRHDGAVEIVEGPPALPQGEPEGLDARDVLPPLLCDGVLMDFDGVSAWEAHMVRVLAGATSREGATSGEGQAANSQVAPANSRPVPSAVSSADAALARLEADLRELQRWRPGGTTLAEAVAGLKLRPLAAAESAGVEQPSLDEVVVGRYLAARAFASWEMYQRGGPAGVLRALRAILATLREYQRQFPLKDAIRRTDLHHVHLARR